MVIPLALSTNTAESPIINYRHLFRYRIVYRGIYCCIDTASYKGLAISPKCFIPNARATSSMFSSSSSSSSISTLLPWRLGVSKTSVMGLVKEVERILTVFYALSICVPIADRCSGCGLWVPTSNTRCDDCGVCVSISRASILGWEWSVFFFLLLYCSANNLRRKSAILFMNVASLISSSRIFIRNATHLSYGCRLFLCTTRLDYFEFVFTVFSFSLDETVVSLREVM